MEMCFFFLSLFLLRVAVEVGSGKRDGTLYWWWLVLVLFSVSLVRGNDPRVCIGFNLRQIATCLIYNPSYDGVACHKQKQNSDSQRSQGAGIDENDARGYVWARDTVLCCNINQAIHVFYVSTAGYVYPRDSAGKAR